MRKVLSFVLVLSLVLGSFGMAFAATPLSDIAGEKSEDAVKVLTQLGVVSGYPDGTYKPGNIVTRAEMAVIVVRALGLADYAAGTASFKDMAGHWSNPYVAYANSLGVIAGYPDGTFKPDATVSYDEAATMLVAALGYTPDSLQGTWPANYVVKAKSLGILDGIKAGAGGANRGDVATMTFQTLAKDIGKTNKDGDWKENGTAVDPDTMLSRLGAKEKAGGAFVLTDSDAEDAVANVREFIGAYVTAYVNSDDEIIAIKEVKSTFLTGKFTTIVTSGTVADNDVFEASDVEYKAALVTGAATPKEFVNGEEKTITPGFTTGTEYKIAADVSGKRIKEVYSVSAWTISDHFMFEDGDLEDDALHGNDFKMNDDDEIDLNSFALLGVDSLEDIKEDNVVYVYSNVDGIARIEVGTEVVEGEITRISGGDKYTIAGKAYKVAGKTSGFTVASVLQVEYEVEAYLDYEGKIYDAEKVTGKAATYGVVVGGVNKASYITDAKLELFLPDGTKKLFVVDTDDAKIGGATFNYGTNINDNNLVKYGLNKNGEIDALEIVTPVNAGAVNNITKSGYHNGYKIASDAFIVVDANITGTGFAVEASADEYSIGNLQKLIDDSYDDILYVLNSSDQIVVLVVEGAGAGGDEYYGVLNGKFSTSDIKNGAVLMVGGKDGDYSSDAAVNTANDKYLYRIVDKTDGKVTLTYLNGSVAGSPADDLEGSYTGAYIENSRIKDGSALDKAVNSDTVVYKYDDGWTKISINAIKKTDTVYIYETDSDNDGLVTFILVR